MSKNAVDAAIRVAYRYRRPLMLIPSRRQIETAEHGGGYVESWDTETFAAYVRKRDPRGLILLCRDHGGPYQNPLEVRQGYSLSAAMKSAAQSYEEDIRQGFHLLHIDTSMDPDGPVALTTAVDRAVDLYRQCMEFTRSQGADSVLLEIGFEDQGCDTNDPMEFEEQVRTALDRLGRAGLPAPTFIVAQTATKVVETTNIGALTVAPLAIRAAVLQLARITRRYGISLKAHNCDYLSREQLVELDRAGVGAINVAPEFGLAESRAFASLLTELGLNVQLERFLAAAYDSRAWEKWMRPGTRATDVDRAMIAGHYVFSTETFRGIREVARQRADARGVDLDVRLREAVERAIEHYATVLFEEG